VVVKVTADPAPLVARTRSAFDVAVDDTVEYARQIAPRATGRFAASITRTDAVDEGGALVAHIGSPLVSARAHELGAFIMAKRARFLQFQVGGHWVRVLPPGGVRIRAHPTVLRAGPRFVEFMSRRMSGSGSSQAFARPDTRPGRIYRA
jgi:hypothetical protein